MGTPLENINANYTRTVNSIDLASKFTGVTGFGMDAALCTPFSMNGSIMPFGMGVGMGVGTGYGCYDPTMMINYQKQMAKGQYELDNMQIDRNFDRQEYATVKEGQVTVKADHLAEKMEKLKNLIDNGNQDLVYSAYEEAVEAYKTRYQQPGQPEIKTEFAEAGFKEDFKEKYGELPKYIAAQSDSPFMDGAKRGIGFGLGSLVMPKTKGTDNIHKIDGTAPTPAEKAQNTAGVVTSVLLSIAAIPLLIKGGKKGAEFLERMRNPIAKGEKELAKGLEGINLFKQRQTALQTAIRDDRLSKATRDGLIPELEKVNEGLTAMEEKQILISHGVLA